MERSHTVARGAAEGASAAIVATLVGAAPIWLLQFELELLTKESMWSVPLQDIPAAVAFGVVLSYFVGDRAVAVATGRAGLVLVAAVLAIQATAVWSFFLLLVPFVTIGAVALSLKQLVAPVAAGRRWALGVWLVAGGVAAPLVLFGVTTLAPWLLQALDPLVTGAGSIAVVDGTVTELLFVAVFYPNFFPITLPIVGTFYGAGLRAVGVGASAEEGERDVEKRK